MQMKPDISREMTPPGTDGDDDCPLRWFDADRGAFESLEQWNAEHPGDFLAGEGF